MPLKSLSRSLRLFLLSGECRAGAHKSLSISNQVQESRAQDNSILENKVLHKVVQCDFVNLCNNRFVKSINLLQNNAKSLCFIRIFLLHYTQFDSISLGCLKWIFYDVLALLLCCLALAYMQKALSISKTQWIMWVRGLIATMLSLP